MSYRVQSIERGIDILKALTSGPRSVTEIAAETNLAKGTAFRLLASLGYHQFVVREPGSSRYLLGPGLLPLIQEIASTFGWIGALASEPLRDLWEETGETITVHVRIGTDRVCVEEIPSAQAVRYTASVGATDPIHVGSAGKVLLAFLDERELAKLLPQLRLGAVTDRSITNRADLDAQLRQTRERGWAQSAGERIEGSAAISVPVRLPGMIAALSVLGPAQRMNEEKQQSYIPLARKTAEEIERLVSRQNGDGTK
jgi:DNA-binding IclR family transcriptional regulator